eukprot:jgi/Botrbrau1/22360/Bobra.0002s0037.1
MPGMNRAIVRSSKRKCSNFQNSDFEQRAPDFPSPARYFPAVCTFGSILLAVVP